MHKKKKLTSFITWHSKGLGSCKPCNTFTLVTVVNIYIKRKKIDFYQTRTVKVSEVANHVRQYSKMEIL